MNYIVEINAFHQRQETNPLSVNARSLWHTLMQVNNRAGWITVFTVAVSTLCDKANLSESAFKRARIELVEKGYIYYKSRGGNLAAQYQMITAAEYTLNEETVSTLAPCAGGRDEESSKEPLKEPSKNSALVDDNVGALVKQNQTKQITTTTTEALNFFETNFGQANPFLASEINSWINEVGELLVLEAMKRANERGKTNWGYVKAILKSWAKQGFKTVEDVQCEVTRFSEKQQARVKKNRQRSSGEVIPDWFHDRKKTTMEGPKQSSVDNKTCEELASLMAAYASG